VLINMMRCYLIVLILVLGVYKIQAQAIDSIIIFLQSKNLSKIDSSLKSITKDKEIRSANIYRYSNIYSQQLVDSFYECDIRFEETTSTYTQGVFNLRMYTAHSVRFKNELIYYKLVNYSQLGYPILEIYKNDSMLLLMSKAYRKDYGRSITTADLFNDNIRYGSRCGRSQHDPEYRTKLEKAIKWKQIRKLNSWLSSPTIELQMYGVEGFIRLGSKGYKFSKKQTDRIVLIASKQGKISVCGGCTSKTLEISALIKSLQDKYPYKP
jgi:hypothetical protein